MPENNRFPHLALDGPSSIHGFTNKPQLGTNSKFPPRNRAYHSQYIERRLTEAWQASESSIVAGQTERNGIYLEFKGKAGYDLATKRLENMGSKKIRLCNIRVKIERVDSDDGTIQETPVTYATVYVPNDQRQYFTKKVQEYANKENTKSIKRYKIFPMYENYSVQLEEIFDDINATENLKVKSEVSNDQILALTNTGIPEELVELLKKTPKNSDLIEGIEDIKKAIARSFWVDSPEVFPTHGRQWCEVWLRSDSEEIEQEFITVVSYLELPVKPGRIRFPERIVKMIHASGEELESLQNSFAWIAEYRRAKETASYWVEQSNRDQVAWTEDLIDRLEVDSDSLISVCILDNGVNNGHPLLLPVLDDVDKHAVDESWGTHDHDIHGHGTSMAGLIAYGDLQHLLESDERISLTHKLESSKILPPPPRQNDPELWGDITKQGISRAEIQAPDRKRIICMAITANDTRDQGTPSSWSGAIDQIVAGVEDNIKRLFLVSAGNYSCEFNNLKNYPDTQILDSLHDPAQTWNAISIGAFTNMTTITDPTMNGYTPIASPGEISPFTTTSFTWKNKWPIKPEVVFEGGNLAIEEDSEFLTQCADLSLLTTNFEPQRSLFTSFNMTSAATAQASYFAAKIQAQYPDYWPETIRALMIHSAEWTDGMKAQFPEDNPNKKINKLLKAVGYGVPDLNRALFCANNSLTLVSQAVIQPYEEIQDNNGKKRKTKDMHFYNLPWPSSVLEDMENIQVEMRITLSYFIEPGPEQVGWKDRYRYPSHLLRFDINSPLESQGEFLTRINAAMQDEENGNVSTPSASNYWVIGSHNRDKGSIHSDIWRGTAVELAASNLIAISPRIGWWKERYHLGKINSQTRYSLIVSIKTPEQNVDIYTPVATQISTPITIQVDGS